MLLVLNLIFELLLFKGIFAALKIKWAGAVHNKKSQLIFFLQLPSFIDLICFEFENIFSSYNLTPLTLMSYKIPVAG